MSHVVYSNRLEALLLVLKEALFAKTTLPFEKRFILVPREEMKDVIFSFLALDPQMQIASGIKVIPLSSFFSEIVEARIPSRLSLSFQIQEVLLQEKSNPLFAPVQGYLKEGAGKRLGMLSDELSLLFHRYGLYGEVVAKLRFCRFSGSFEPIFDSNGWGNIDKSILPQPFESKIGQNNPKNRRTLSFATTSGEKTLEAWLQEEGWQQFLWKRLDWMYPIKALSQELPRKQWNLHVFGFSELPPIYVSFLKRLSVTFYEISCCSVFWEEIASEKEQLFTAKKLGKTLYREEGNPLLAHFGKMGRRKASRFDQEGIEALAAYVPPQNHFLGAIQRALLEMKPFEGLIPDDSLQIHAAFHAAQEVEILYEQLIFLMAKEGIGREDVLILSPDIDAYLPWISQIFGKETSQLAFRVYGIQEPRKKGFLNGIKALLRVVREDFSVSSVFDLLTFALQEQFTFSEEEVSTLYTWVEHAHIREGKEDWQAGLDRLLLGLAVIPEEEKSYAIFPEQLLEWSDADLLEKFILFFQELSASLLFFSEREKLPVSTWLHALQKLGETFFSDEDRSLYEFLTTDVTPVPFSAVERVLNQEKLSKLLNPKLHAVTCAALTGDYIQKARITCLLGMNEETFPRRDLPSSLDTMRASCSSLSEKDHYRFLEVLMNTTDHLYLSYVKIDPKDKQEKGPSSVLTWLQDHVGVQVTHHPLPVFNARTASPTFVSPIPLEPLPPLIRMQHLRQLARNSLQFYLSCGLGIYLDEKEGEELLLSPLDKASLRQQGTKGRVGALLNTYAARGKLPKGAFGAVAVSDVREETARYEETLKSLNLLESRSYTVEFSHLCQEKVEHGEGYLLFPAISCEKTLLIGKIKNIFSQGLLFHGEDSLEDLLKIFPLFLSFYQLPFEKNLFFTKDATVKHCVLKSSHQLLERYLEFYRQALTTPLPFLPQWIPFFLKGEEKKWRKALSGEEDPSLQWILRRDPELFDRMSFQELQTQAVHFFGEIGRLYGI